MMSEEGRVYTKTGRAIPGPGCPVGPNNGIYRCPYASKTDYTLLLVWACVLGAIGVVTWIGVEIHQQIHRECLFRANVMDMTEAQTREACPW